MRSSLIIAMVLALLRVGAAEGASCGDLTTQNEMNACVARDAQKVDDKLNATFKQLQAKIQANHRPKLIAAEKAWLAYRDAQCAFNTLGTEGGSIQPMVQALCLKDLTSQQVKVLEQQLNCPEGDVACGGQ